MITQQFAWPLTEMAHQRHQELLREAEHVRMARRLKPQRNRLARRLLQTLYRVVTFAQFRLPLRDLETA